MQNPLRTLHSAIDEADAELAISQAAARRSNLYPTPRSTQIEMRRANRLSVSELLEEYGAVE